MPEELKSLNTTIQLDSKTAELIANKYITYKYYETGLTFVGLLFMAICVCLLIKKMVEEL